MTITIDLSNWRCVLQQCCSALIEAGRKSDAEQLWTEAQTARDATEIVAKLPDDVQPEFVWRSA